MAGYRFHKNILGQNTVRDRQLTAMRISVKVQPRASREEIQEISDGLKVYLKESATDGKANEALRRVLGKHFNVAKSFVTIIRGEQSRNKVIEINKGD